MTIHPKQHLILTTSSGAITNRVITIHKMHHSSLPPVIEPETKSSTRSSVLWILIYDKRQMIRRQRKIIQTRSVERLFQENVQE